MFRNPFNVLFAIAAVFVILLNLIVIMAQVADRAARHEARLVGTHCEGHAPSYVAYGNDEDEMPRCDRIVERKR